MMPIGYDGCAMSDESGVPELRRPPTADELAEAVRSARNDRGLSQDALAEQAGTTRLTISRIESGRFNPSARILFGVVVALGSRLFFRHLWRAMGGDSGGGAAMLAAAGLAAGVMARTGGAVART